MARFERLTLPDNKGTRNVALRFLKIITPVRCVVPLYDGSIVPPKEGELHRRTNTKYRRSFWKATDEFNPPVWIGNIDNCPTRRGLQLLWDT